jgi:hypothetical protein
MQISCKDANKLLAAWVEKRATVCFSLVLGEFACLVHTIGKLRHVQGRQGVYAHLSKEEHRCSEITPDAFNQVAVQEDETVVALRFRGPRESESWGIDVLLFCQQDR